MVTVFIVFLAAALVIGIGLGLTWRGTLLLGDRRAVDRLASQLATELHLQARTEATLRAMREATRDAAARSGGKTP